MKKELSRNDTALLKGFAITFIVLHNFCHWLPECVSENEYTFHIKNSWQLVRHIAGGEHVLLNLFSYFGHYGVPVFLFLSGYGLVKKYEGEDAEHVSLWRFTRYHALKLWRLLAPGLLIWATVNLTENAAHRAPLLQNLAGLLTFTANFFKQPHLHQIEGPWWVFSLIMQLYVFYRIFLYRKGNLPLIIFTILCVTLQLGLVTWGGERQEWLNYMRYNFPGSMLPFAAGIVMARYGVIFSWKQAIISLLVVISGCFNACIWTIAPLFVVLSALLLTRIGGYFRQAMEWLGRLSAIIFVVHPLVRGYVITWAKESTMPYLPLFCYATITVITAVAYKFCSQYLPRPHL